MNRSQRVGVLALLLAVLLGVGSLLWSALSSHAQGLEITFLDVGQGDAILIESPTGRRMLIDGGADAGVLQALAQVIPWWDRRVDIVLATHPDLDHVGGLVDVLERYRVSYVVDNSIDAETSAVESFLNARVREQAVAKRLFRGERIVLGGGAVAEILFPDRQMAGADTNEQSIVVRVVYGGHSFLLTGDAPSRIERYLVSLNGSMLKSTVLKAGHHGSNTSSDVSFVGTVSPEYAVFSRGCDNSYGHPHEEVVSTFLQFGVHTYDTCLHGSITFKTDGTLLRVETKK